MYNPTPWKDHVTSPSNVFYIHKNNDETYTITPAGEVMQQGTPQDQTNFNNMECGIFDAHISLAVLLNFARQMRWDVDAIEKWITDHDSFEIGTTTMTNSLAFPFNNSKKSVSLAKTRNTTNYVVMAEVTTFSGNVGEVEISDKLVNGFKIAYTGSASTVSVKYVVIGGFEA